MRTLLSRYGIAEMILNRWEKRFDGKLLPLQYRAVTEYDLLEGQSLLISAPTSSGKTFCGEMALIRAIQNRKKGIFLVPLKAVAEEKYRQFAGCYNEPGLTITIATRDHPENDEDIARGRFNIAVMVYEKFNAALLSQFDLMSQVDTVVIDELQMLADPVRGPHLELALTKLLYSKYNPQIVALSAVVGEATGLAAWLGCRLLLDKSRPVELKRGVAANGKFYFRCHNSGERGEEEFPDDEEPTQTLFRRLSAMVSDNRQALVFLKSRRDTVRAATRFAEYAGLEVRDDNRSFFDAALSDEEDSSLLRNLRSLLDCGVAFHNADLTAAQRLAVEGAYRRGLIQVVFATTTLATGINLPAATVFVEAQKYNHQGYTGRPNMEPLTWAEYESMSGRAGRAGLLGEKEAAGRAVLIAAGELEKSILWDYYIDKQPDPLQSQLAALDEKDILLDLFASKLVDNSEEVFRLLNRTYCARQKSHIFNIKEEIFKQLLEVGFLQRSGDSLCPTPLATAAASNGLTVATARYILNIDTDMMSEDNDQIIHRLLQSPDGKSVYIPPVSKEDIRRLSRRFHSDGCSFLTQALSGQRRELTAEERCRIKLTFLLSDWMRGMSSLDIENEYCLHPGMMEKIGGQTGWLLASAASVLRAHDRLSRLPDRLDRLAFSARTGLPQECRTLRRAVGDVLHRGEYLTLHREGISDLEDFVYGGLDILRHRICSEDRLRRIEKTMSNIRERIMHATQIRVSHQPVIPESIEIDGTPVRERFLVRINNRPISLTGKSFKYLVRLVWSRLTKDNGWLYKEDIEKGFNQARYLYRLRQEIGRDFLPDWPLYENNRSGYYRLAVGRDRLRVNVEALKEFPDCEIQQMAHDLAGLSMA